MMRIIILEDKATDQAIQSLIKSGMFSEEEAKAFIERLEKGANPEFHAFVNLRGNNWLSKYIKGILRMMFDYIKGDSKKIDEFLERYKEDINYYLEYLKSTSEKPSPRTEENAKQIDDEFLNKISPDELVDKVAQIKAEEEATEEAELANQQYSGHSDYEIIPIESWEEFVEMFDQATGDGNDRPGGYCGNGGSGWCYLNDSTYYTNVENGRNQFFVLAKDGWEDLQFDETTSRAENGKDEYGNSLIAVLVNKSTGRILKCTCRANHKDGSNDTDQKYKYNGLNRVANRNVKKFIYDYLGLEFHENNSTEIVYEDGRFDDDSDDDPNSSLIKTIRIKNSRFINNRAFENFSKVTTIIFEDNVTTYIGNSAFEGCSSLKSIEIPDSVTDIGPKAFSNCKSLESVKLPSNDGYRTIAIEQFKDCVSLKSVEIPSGIIKINSGAFYNCKSLESVSLNEYINRIGMGAFYGCSSLKSIVIENEHCKIGNEAFTGTNSSFKIYVPEGSYTQESCESKGYECEFI